MGGGLWDSKKARRDGATAAAAGPIPVQVINGDGFIWDADGALSAHWGGRRLRPLFPSTFPRMRVPPARSRLIKTLPSLSLPPFPDARRLRADHRLVGAMVGGVAGFKQQNSFCGLPLRLGPAELAVAVRGGWVAPYEVPCAPSALDPFHPNRVSARVASMRRRG